MSAGIGGINVDGAAGAAGGAGITNINISAGTTSNNLSAVTFANTTGVSFGLNASTITATIGTIQGVSGLTFSTATAGTSVRQIELSNWKNYSGFPTFVNGAGYGASNTRVSIFPFFPQCPIVFSNLAFQAYLLNTSAANTSSAYANASITCVFYTRNVSTLSYLTSFSNTLTSSFASNAQLHNNVIGITVSNAAATTLTQGEYFMALHFSTTNSATNTSTATTAISQQFFMCFVPGNTGAIDWRSWGAASNATGIGGQCPGAGIIATGATRSSIAFSDYSQTGAAAQGAVGNVAFEFRNVTWWG